MAIGLGASLSKTGVVTPGIVTDSLVLKHNYAAGGVTPVSDGAGHFAGSAEHINCGSDSTLNPATNITITAWVFPRTLDDYRYIVNRGDDFNGAYRLELGATNIYAAFGTGSANTAISYAHGMAINNWYHVAVTYDSYDAIVYVDGVSKGTTAITRTMEQASHDTLIGEHNPAGGNPFDGYICNVGLWSAVLAQPLIKSIMWKNYAGLTSSEKTNLVSWWNLDETIHTAADGLTHVHDNHYGGTDAELGAELWSNVNFDDASAWNDQGLEVDDSVALSTEQVKNGSYSLKITVDAAGEGTQQNVIATAGKLYKVSGWFYVLSGVAKFNPDDSHFTSGTEILTTKTNEWEYISGYLRASATGTVQQVYIQASSSGATFYVDSVSFKEVQGNTGELK